MILFIFREFRENEQCCNSMSPETIRGQLTGLTALLDKRSSEIRLFSRTSFIVLQISNLKTQTEAMVKLMHF